MRPTEMNNQEGTLDALPCEERYAKVRTALTNGIPLLCTIDVAMSGTMVGHEIVVDGWKETNETDGQIHLNYGWGGYNDQWVPFETCNVKSFMFGFVPRPKVIPEPILAEAALPVSVRWHFPTHGYEKTLAGFVVSYAEATDTTETWKDDFETQKGAFWGSLITRKVVADCGEDSTVLRIDNDSDRSTYTWPAQLLGSGAELSFRYRSDRAKNQSVSVEAYEASHGWRTLESLELCEADAADWQTRKLSLAAYAGKATAIRFRTERAGVGADKIVGADRFGVQIDDVEITNVRKLQAAKTLRVDADTRACSLGSDVLSVGGTYVITVAPDGVPNGESGYGVATTIVSDEPERVSITGVQSIHSGDYQFDSGIFRNCYIGTNQFAVYTSASATELRATLSHPALIDQTLIDDVAVPGTKTLAPTAVTLVAPKVEQGESGKWLVTLDFSNLTEASLNAQELVMIEAEDALGNVARKEVILDLVAIGNEKAISAGAIPDYSGTPESEEEDEPATPVDPDEPVTPDDPDDPEEPVTPDEPEEPAEETPVVTPTFPKADGAGPNDDATFDFFYPISAPEPESSGGGDVTVKVAVGGEEFDISKAFSKVEKGVGGAVTYTLDPTPGKQIRIGDEQISIQPEFADYDETPFEVQDGKLVFRVKSIPGLKYQVLASETLDPDSFTPAGQEREAISTRRELTVTRSGEIKGFYKVQVSR